MDAFLAVSGQWRIASRGEGFGTSIFFAGLDYAAVRAGLDLAGITLSPDTWADLCLIESGALKELNNGR